MDAENAPTALSSGDDFKNGQKTSCLRTARPYAILTAPAAGWFFGNRKSSENHCINTVKLMLGLGGLEPPTSPLSVLRSLVLPSEMRAFLRQHGRLRRYPPLRVFLLPDFHIRLHNEDAAQGL